MGRALVIGAIEAKQTAAENVVAYDIVSESVETMSKEHGITGSDSLRQVVTSCDTILLCTKPADVPEVLREIATFGTDPNRILLISIAAGVTIASLETFIFNHARVIRAMPNTPALVGKGAAAFSPGSNATVQDVQFVSGLLGSVGKVVEVPEKLMNAVTGLSGSGPAFVYILIEALADGGVAAGLSRDKALELATQTVLGAATMVNETGLHPALLKDMVSSPGGTTIAGIEALEENGFRNAAIKAVTAANQRAIDLGRPNI